MLPAAAHPRSAAPRGSPPATGRSNRPLATPSALSPRPGNRSTGLQARSAPPQPTPAAAYLPPAEKEGAGGRRQAARSPQPSPPRREAEGPTGPARHCRPAAIAARPELRNRGASGMGETTSGYTPVCIRGGPRLAGGHLGSGSRPLVAPLASPKMAAAADGGGSVSLLISLIHPLLAAGPEQPLFHR